MLFVHLGVNFLQTVSQRRTFLFGVRWDLKTAIFPANWIIGCGCQVCLRDPQSMKLFFSTATLQYSICQVCFALQWIPCVQFGIEGAASDTGGWGEAAAVKSGHVAQLGQMWGTPEHLGVKGSNGNEGGRVSDLKQDLWLKSPCLTVKAFILWCSNRTFSFLA